MRLEYFEMVDRITAIALDPGTICATCAVPAQSPVFEGHFPGHPILPGVLMIEAMAQTGGWLVMAKLGFERMVFLAAVKEAKLRQFVTPGQVLHTEATFVHDGSGYAIAEGRILLDGRAIADATLTYRVLAFPNPAMNAGVLAAARRVGVPEELLRHG